jgi:hypothetical protein
MALRRQPFDCGQVFRAAFFEDDVDRAAHVGLRRNSELCAEVGDGMKG